MNSKKCNCNEEGFYFCPLCKEPFTEGDKVSMVTTDENTVLLVHKQCIKKYNIKEESGTDDKSSKPLFQEQDKLWRYMDLSKFIYMMKNSSVYFSSPTQFDDIYEGARSEYKNKHIWDDYYLSFFKASMMITQDNKWHKIDKKTLEDKAKSDLKMITNLKQEWFYVSCWHHNDDESEAMWKIYSSSIENAIAIQTTYGGLKRTFEGNVNIRIEPIRYIDYSKTIIGPNDVYLYKRKAFEYEREVRALLFDYWNKGKTGIEVDVDLNNLIDNVYISPYSPKWLSEVVTDLVSRYGYTFKIHESGMSEKPF